MSLPEDITRFLNVMAETERTKPVSGAKKAMLSFVTISRQAGAGGHTLAQTLIRRMAQETDPLFQSWQICDQQLCEMLLQDGHLNVSLQSLLAEEYRSQIQELVGELFSKQPSQYLIMREMFETIRSLAAIGKVIIVGRGGSQVTKKLETGVHVRLAAPETVRVQRMMRLLGQSEAEARAAVYKQDQDRARLLKSFFQLDINDPLLYDAVWNTSTVPFEVIAEAIVSLIKHRIGLQDPTQAPG